MDVKPEGRSSSTSRPAGLSAFWMGYFLLNIALVGCLSAYLICIPLFMLGRFFPTAFRAANRILQKAIYFLMKIQPWLNFKVETAENSFLKREGPALFVSNHRSHLDVFLFLARVPGIKVFAKDSLFRVPFLGVMMRASKQIKVKRGNVTAFTQAQDRVLQRLKNQENVLVFPEMTRCAENFLGTQNFSLSFFQMARNSGVPVVPVVIKGSDHAWPKNSFRLRYGKEVLLKELACVYPGDFSSAGSLKDHVQALINQELNPV